MDSNPRVELSPAIIDRCNRYAGRKVSAGDFKNSVSYRGAENNLDLQAHAKMCECAAARSFGLDPITDLWWKRGVDSGCDLVVPKERVLAGEARHIDVKGVKAGRRFLLWPIKKNRLYKQKHFDTLLLIRGDAPEFEVVGWIGKKYFWRRHEVATENHPLDTGTWYMDAGDLLPLSSLYDPWLD